MSETMKHVTPRARRTRPKPDRPVIDIRYLWMLRILVPLKGSDWLLQHEEFYACEKVAEFVGLPPTLTKGEVADRKAALRTAWLAAERRAGDFRLNEPFSSNLEKVGHLFGLHRVERQVLGLALAASFDPIIEPMVAEVPALSRQIHQPWARILGLSVALIRRALSAQARLARASLFQAESPLMQAVSALQINRPELGGVYSDRQWSPGRLLAGMARRAPDPELSREDYPHLASDIDLMARYLRKSLARRRKGVNILLHGSPGAGKTQLSRLLGKSLEAEVFEVDPANADGESSHGTRRFAMLATMQKLLAHRRALIVFDETDQVFSDGNWFAGVRSTADRMRPWLVDHLESNPVPTIWIGNDLRSLDPAFARRFDIVLEMKAAPRAQRTAMIRQHAGAFLDDQRIRRLSQVEALSPATLRRAARVVAGAGLRTGSAGPAMERLIDQSLRIQSRNPRHDPIPPLVVAEYDPSLSQASSDLDALADGLGRTGEGRLCLYGPPGTGKSAFGHWLGERLGRPVTVQRASDLLGAFVGETEANISRAFKQAYQDGSILQIDEVDGFLGDRQQARARWEASLVNEMLTQMEAFRGIFVASTNLMEGLDPAALRRFDAKVLFGYLRPDQSSRLLVALCQRFGLPTPTQSDDALTRLAALDSLTPGDFASAARRHLFDPYRGFSEIVAALADECRLKPGGGARRIGFV